jgi:hypothetical protein
MTVLCATDLDRTLIYSRAALGDVADRELMPVEQYDGADASWMTAGAATRWTRLAELACAVPVTTRTPAQWRRIALPGPASRWVVAANGGVLLVDGVADEPWAARVRAALKAVASIDEIWGWVTQACAPEWTRALRIADDLFCYAVLVRERFPAEFVAGARAWAAPRGWQVSLQGRKLYWVPGPLTKSAAVAELSRRVGASTVLAAGDSLLDADLLAAADAGVAARHGELVASGWTAPHVRVTEHCGARAGEEIADWLLTSLALVRDGVDAR